MSLRRGNGADKSGFCSKTGVTLRETGVRDEHGMEPLDAIFSSPEKSDGTDGEADMDLTTGRGLNLAVQAANITAQRLTVLLDSLWADPRHSDPRPERKQDAHT